MSGMQVNSGKRVAASALPSAATQTPKPAATACSAGPRRHSCDGLALATAAGGVGRLLEEDLATEAMAKCASHTLDAYGQPTSKAKINKAFVQQPDVQALLTCMQQQAAYDGLSGKPALALGDGIFLTEQGLRRRHFQSEDDPVLLRKLTAAEVGQLDFAALDAAIEQQLSLYAQDGKAAILSCQQSSTRNRNFALGIAGTVGGTVLLCAAVSPWFILLPLAPLLLSTRD